MVWISLCENHMWLTMKVKRDAVKRERGGREKGERERGVVRRKESETV